MHYSTACALIFLHYGIEAQKRKLQEECAELIRAIARNDDKNMIEEIADVEILINQFKSVLYYFEEIEKMKTAKIERTLNRINSKKTSCLAVDCLGCACTDKECGMEH